MSIESVVARQQRTGAIYGSGLHGNEFEHRLAVVKARHPKVMALGSSRTLAFRESYFSAPFACACLAVQDLPGVDAFLDALPHDAWPETVILGVDYWWLLDDYPETPEPILPRPDSTAANLSKLLVPYGWLARGIVSLDDIVHMEGRRAAHIPLDRIGAQAKLVGRGYRPDGSLFDGYVLTTPGLAHIQRFETNIASIKAGAPPWQRGALVGARLERLKSIVARIQQAGSKVIVILPPFPGRVMEALDANPQYAVLADVRKSVSALPTETYDFTDGRTLGDDCEYLDGRHGGDIVYMRMLSEILRRNPKSALAGVVDLAKIQQEITTSKGRALAFSTELGSSFREADFLGLSCKKNQEF